MMAKSFWLTNTRAEVKFMFSVTSVEVLNGDCGRHCVFSLSLSLFLQGRAVIKFFLQAVSTLKITTGEQ